MIKAKLTLPKLETKKVWFGLYGGHYDVIVFFKEKPVKNDEGYYCIHDNGGGQNSKAIGAMSLPDFYLLYPTADLREHTQQRDSKDTLGGRPMDIEIYDVFEMEITTAFNQWGDIYSFHANEDGWV